MFYVECLISMKLDTPHLNLTSHLCLCLKLVEGRCLRLISIALYQYMIHENKSELSMNELMSSIRMTKPRSLFRIFLNSV